MSQTIDSVNLGRLLDPVASCLTPEAARRLVDLRADAQLQERLDYLADQCTEGRLTPEEQREYDAYIHAIHLISLLQASARKRLAGEPA